MPKKALIIAGIVFALLAISHVIRWLAPVEILIDGNTLPLIISLFAGIFLALLSAWMFIAAMNIKETPQENEEKQGKDE